MLVWYYLKVHRPQLRMRIKFLGVTKEGMYETTLSTASMPNGQRYTRTLVFAS